MHTIHSISPYIRAALSDKHTTQCIVAERVIFDYEFLYIKQGEAVITIEDRRYEAQEGDIFIFKPDVRHSIVSGKKGFWQIPIHFDLFYDQNSSKIEVNYRPRSALSAEEIALIRRDDLSGNVLDLPEYIRVEDITVMESMLFALLREYDSHLPLSDINAGAQFTSLLIYLARETYWKENNVSKKKIDVMLICQYLTDNLHHAITLDELSERFNISKFHLARVFKEAFHMSPIHYHQYFRLCKAKSMLQLLNITIAEVSNELGFDSPNTFSRAFKRQFGEAPSHFQPRHLK